MTQLKGLIFILLIFACAAVETFGGGQNRAGTNAAPELLIPLGSRYLAMSGANIASVSGLEAIYWNPAGVDLSETSANALFSYRSYFADMSMDYIAIGGRLGELGTLGLSFRSLNIGTINVTTMQYPDGTGEQINPSYFVLGLTYSKQLTDRISIGANVNLINESWARVNATGYSFDAGVQYTGLFDIPNFAVGVAVKNLGASMKYGGNGLWVKANDQSSSRGPTYYEIGAQSSELPSLISIGLSYSRNIDDQNALSIAGSFYNNNYSYDNYNVGLEYSYNKLLFLRAGYLYTPQATTETPNIYQNFTAGVGVNFQNIGGVNIAVDYAYVPVKYFTANNSFTVRIGF